MGSLMMQYLRDSYPNTKIISFSVLPSAKLTDAYVFLQPYNAGLTIHKLDEYCDGVFVIDNEALWDINMNVYKRIDPTYEYLNFIANELIHGVTSLFRYNDSVGFNVNTFLAEMIKLPNLKYLSSALAPFYDKEGKILESEKYDDTFTLTKSLFDFKRNFVSNSNEKWSVMNHDQDEGDVNGTVKEENVFTNLSTLIVYPRFEDDNSKIIKSVQKLEERRYFMNDIISTVIKNYPENKLQKTTMIETSTLIRKPLERINYGFDKLHRKRAFFYWYKGEGMEDFEFQEAAETMNDLINRYEKMEVKSAKTK